jgi:hypothetical protein
MSVKATFAADFTSFTKAVRDAEVQLGDLEVGASSVQKSLTKIGTALGGSKLIQEATLTVKAIEELGGATKLTGNEQVRVNALVTEAIAKYAALGQTAPSEMVALAEATKQPVKATETLGVSFGSLVKSMLTAEAISASIRGVWSAFTGTIAASITAANEAEAAQVKLTAAMRTQGTDVPSVVKAYDEYAAALSQTTIYQDDALTSATALLVTIGNVMPQDMKKALEATTNLASGLGIDLESAAHLVAKAAEGQTTALKKSGVVIDETKAKAQGFGFVLDTINDKFGGQAAALAGTYQGRLTQLGNAWNNVEESIGRVITQNATVLKAIELLTTGLASNTDELNANKTLNDLVSESILGVVKATRFLLGALDLTQQGYHLAAQASDWYIGKVLGVAAAYLEVVSTVGKYTKYVNPLGSVMEKAGAGAEYLRGMVQGLNDHMKESGAASASWSKRLDEADKIVGAFGDELEKTRGKTVELARGTQTATDAWGRHTTAAKTGKEAVDEYAKALASVDSFATPFLDRLYSIDGAVVEGARALLDNGAAAGDVAKAYELTDGQIHAIVESMKNEVEWLKVVAENHKATMGIAVDAEKKIRDEQAATLAATNKNTIENLNTQKSYNDKLVAMSASAGDQIAAEWTTALNLLGPPRQGFEQDWQRTVDSIDRYFAAKMSAGNMAAAVKAAGIGTGNAFKDSLLATLDDVPALLQKSLTGGGGFAGFGKSLAAGLGADIGKAVGSSNLAGSLADGLAKITGASGASAAGGIMSLVTNGLTGGIAGLASVGVSLVGKLITKVFNNPEKQINPIRQGFIDAAGGLDALNQKAFAATGSLTLVQNVLGAKNADQYKAAIDSLTAALNAHQAAVAATVTTYGTIGEKLNSVTTISGPLKAALDAAMSSTTAEGFKTALENVGKEIDAQAAKQGALNALVSKYGLDWTASGEAFRQAKINEVAGGLISDFTNLSTVFSNLNPVMEGMKKPLAEFIGEAQKAGVVVPAGMKQVIQTAIDAGTVFDEAGVKVTDLNALGIKFGDESSQGADDVNVAMAGLADTMNKILQPEIKTATDDASALAKALKDLPPDIVTRVHFVADPFPTPPGSTAAPAGTPGFATGTGGRFVDFGSGTLAMLHGREAIVPEGQSAGGASAEHLIGLRQDMTELRRVLVAEQRLAPERLTLALRGLLAVAR